MARQMPQKVIFKKNKTDRMVCFLDGSHKKPFFPDKQLWPLAREGAAVVMEVVLEKNDYGFVNGYMNMDGPDTFRPAPKPKSYEPILPACVEIRPPEQVGGRLYFTLPNGQHIYYPDQSWTGARPGPAYIKEVTTEESAWGFAKGETMELYPADLDAYADALLAGDDPDVLATRKAMLVREGTRYKGEFIPDYIVYSDVDKPADSDWCFACSSHPGCVAKLNARHFHDLLKPAAGYVSMEKTCLNRGRSGKEYDPAELRRTFALGDSRFMATHPRIMLELEDMTADECKPLPISNLFYDAILDGIILPSRPRRKDGKRLPVSVPIYTFAGNRVYRLCNYANEEITALLMEYGTRNQETDKTLENLLVGGIIYNA